MKYYVAEVRRKGSKNVFRKIKVAAPDLQTAINSFKAVCEIRGEVKQYVDK